MSTVLPSPSRPLAPLPTRAEVRAAIPDDCFERSTARSLLYLAGSLALVGALVGVGTRIPLAWAWSPVWMLYAVACGTAATGLWVIAHECGHGAFSSRPRLQDAIGYVLHTALLVPYFSWQRSHSVHHARTNHLDEGETHVPKRATHPRADAEHRLRRRIGRNAYGVVAIGRTLLLGWPAYLVAGVTGATGRGRTNHFWPVRPFAGDLFPPRWHRRVWMSSLGVVAVLGLLGLAAWHVGVAAVAALYVGPYLVVNAWLVGYTWLQHTDTEVPHFAAAEWSWLLGAFQTIDRPYGRVLDLLHHRIGSTHVAHHIDHRIPHYHAKRATEAVAAAFPDWYRYDPTPVGVALWRVGRDCVAVDRSGPGWTFAANGGDDGEIHLSRRGDV